MKPTTLRRNALAAAGQTLVQTAVFVLMYRYLVGRLGVEQFGIWAVVLATASAARVSELGLATSVTKFVAVCRAQGDDRGASATLQTAALTLAVVLGVMLVVAAPVLSILLSRVLPGAAIAQGQAILPYALVSMWLSAVSGIWLGGLDGCLRSDLRASVVIVCTLGFAGMMLVGVPAHGLVGLAAAQVGQGVLLVVLGWVAVRRAIGGMPVVPVRWERARFRDMLGYGVHVQVIAAVLLLLDPMTKILFVRYGGLSAAGHFELAQQLVLKMRAFIVETNRIVVPVMAGMEDASRTTRLYARNVTYLLFLLTPLFAGLASLVPVISEFWLGRYEIEFVVMTVALTIAWYMNSVTAPAYFAYMGQGKLRWLTASHVMIGASNGVLGLALGSAFGWGGVLAAFCVSLALGSLIPVWAYHREHGLNVRDVVANDDLILMLACLAAAATAITVYAMAVRFDLPAALRFGPIVLTTIAMMTAVWRHPLASEVWMSLRRKLPAR